MKAGVSERELLLHSIVVLLFLSAALSGLMDIPTVSLALILWGLIFFTVLYALGQKARPLPPADAITAIRLLLGMVFFLLARSSALGPLPALLMVIFIELADGLDGWVARRTKATKFGGIWDMESDAFIILLLSVGAYWYADLPIWVLVPGIIRYVFFFPFLFLKHEDARFSAALSWYSKTICVAAVFCLASAWYLPNAASTAIAIVSFLITVSFGWETIHYIYFRIQTRKR